MGWLHAVRGSDTRDHNASIRDFGGMSGQTVSMTGKPLNPMSHFGKQLKKERLAHGWSLPELSKPTGIDAGHLSRLENGKRPPTEAIVLACDDVFPERRGWFLEYYEESKSWAPPGFRVWA